MNNFSTILWDAGGVIVGFDQAKCDEKLASSSNKSASEVSTILFGDSIKGKGYNDGLVEKFNLGRISSKEFYESVRIALGLNMGYRDFAEAWIDIFSINEKILAFMRKAAARGIRQGILSSTNPLHWDKMNQLCGLESLLGKNNILCTYHPDARMKKPDLKLFDCALQRLKAKKEETVYVDDIEKYLAAARTYGFGATVHVNLDNPSYQEKCIKDLGSLGFHI